MATFFRRNQLEDIHAGAEVRPSGGKRFAHWTDEAERAQKKEVVSTRTGDKLLVGRDAVWSGKIKLAKGRWKTVRLFTDKTASERRLAEPQKAADRGAAGCTTAETDRLGLPIAALATQYIESLRVQKLDPEHIRISEWMLNRLIDLGGWKQFADVTMTAMEKVLNRLKADGATVSYRNKFIKRAKAFVAALLPDGWPNPLAKLKRINEKGAMRTRERRAANAVELATLFALELPEDRKLCYALAVYNGLRRNEIQNLRWVPVGTGQADPVRRTAAENGRAHRLRAAPPLRP
jgi:integrase